ncbi:related to Putative transferase CAF17, mitochondrial [Cephalotrichum gorgonifer]|uniref:Iron-sulfur cluster assembly factor IBA57 homolog, mitochondrial n=1 Tax=Cephalotrichum gorgonifer TaxID=2041049 RepID=A0AAE8SX54_9PEZI|nr:related to Putative transferase CAF17, mitochondrial [Cephalotrichum gorgonifer]
MPTPNVTRGVARLSRRLLSLSGPDAASFLQGMMSSALLRRDGALIPRASAVYAGLFTPNGRVQNDILVYPRPPADDTQATPDYLVEVDGSEASRLAKRLRFYKLRAKFNMRVLDPSELSVFHLWDDAGRDTIAGLQARGLAEGAILSEDPRLAALGYRMLAAGDGVPAGVELDAVSEESYKVRRYLHGIPENQDEIPSEVALPLEYNMELMNGIDFKKGCYVGQELQARTKYLGVVQKRVLPCILYDGAAPPEALEYRPTTDGGASADDVESGVSINRVQKEGDPPPSRRDRKPGKWIAGVGNVGLAVCRLAVMTDVVPPHPADMPMKLTYAPADEFAVEAAGGEVKVRAFVPTWLREGLSTYRD